MKTPRWDRFPAAVGTPAFVLDVSVAVAWALWNRYDRYALDVAGRLTKTPCVVSRSWCYEVVETVLSDERSGRTTAIEVDQYLGWIAVFRIFVDSGTPDGYWHSVVALARTHGLTVAQSGSLELAVRTGLPLATLNSTQSSLAGSLGISLFIP
jgi:hypothetical protein